MKLQISFDLMRDRSPVSGARSPVETHIVWSGVSTIDHQFESVEVVVPSREMVRDRVVGESPVDETKVRLLSVGRQGDLHLCRTCGNRMVGKIPSEREDHALIRNHLEEFSGARIDAATEDAKFASWHGIQRGLSPHPLHKSLRIDKVRKDGRGRGLDRELLDDFGPHACPFVCSLDSARSRSRSRLLVQNESRNARSLAISPWLTT